MKKIYLLLLFFGALLFCACEKENIDPLVEDQAQLEESALKGADKNGMTQKNLTPWPIVARMGSGAEFVIPATEEYGVIIFYVNDPSVIAGHNFSTNGWYFHNGWSFSEDAFSVEGTSWHLPDYPMAPHHYHAKGKGAVLVWIITIEQVMELYINKAVTIPNILACAPMVGHATSYNEVLRPYGGGAPVLGGVINAKGMLDDGRRFVYYARSKVKPGGPLETKNKLEIFDK